MEPGHIISLYVIDNGESAANKDFAIRLDGESIDKAVCTGAEVDGCISLAIWVQASDPVASHPVEQSKVTADQNLPI